MDGWASVLAGWPRGGTDAQMDKQTDKQKISSFYRTLSPIGPAALPPPMKSKEKVEQGKGTADHLMPLGYLLPCVDVKVGSALTSLCRRSLLATYKMFIRSLFDYGARSFPQTIQKRLSPGSREFKTAASGQFSAAIPPPRLTTFNDNNDN